MADLLFDHEVGLGMEIVRFNFGASSTDANAVQSMRPFGAVPCVMLQDGTYNWTLVRVLLLHVQCHALCLICGFSVTADSVD